jgi:hypothetical protein
MPRSMVGLLATAAAAMAVLASRAPGYLFWLVLVVVAVAAGLVGYATAPELPFSTDLAAYLALPSSKKTLFQL